VTTSDVPTTQRLRGRAQSRRIIGDVFARAGVGIDGPNPWDLQVHDERFFERLLREGYAGAGESYLDGWWDCDAIDEAVCRLLRADLEASLRLDLRTALAMMRLRFLNLQTIRRAPHVALAHYDLANSFFEKLLGPTMTYSCGYYGRGATTLDEAQDAKHDLICEKLQLRPSDHLLDIGCGWGRLVRHAAAKAGCRATGITVSVEQERWARAAAGGLPVEILLTDYRSEALRQRGPFDKVVSVGMFEHVGTRNHRLFMELVHQLMKDDGLLVLQTIGNHPRTGADPFVDRHLFPNSVLPSQRAITDAIEHLMVIEDWHNFGADYDRTLMAWHANFEAHAAALGFPPGSRRYRTWRFYLLSFAGSFRARCRMQLWQIVLSKRGVRGGYRSRR
jgi:cyclopropane-fatty-acyl-phospholipid synthase